MQNSSFNFIPFDDELEKLFKNHFPKVYSIFTPGFISKGSYPKVDIVEEVDNFKLIAEIPDVDKENLEVYYDQGYLVIKGFKSAPSLGYNDKTKFIQREIKNSKFTRLISIDDSMCDVGSISATQNGNYIEITIPRKKSLINKITIK